MCCDIPDRWINTNVQLMSLMVKDMHGIGSATHTLYCVSTCHKGCSLLNITLRIWVNSQASTIVSVGNETECEILQKYSVCMLVFPRITALSLLLFI